MPAKDPADKLDYTIDWSGVIGSDPIASSIWTVPSGITQDTPAPSFTPTTTTIWLSAGTDAEDYTLINKIATTGGRVVERSIIIPVRNQ
jgi:hypothetical protein